MEAGGILLVTSILTFSGSANPASYSLACVANVLTVTIPKPFTLSLLNFGLSHAVRDKENI